MSERSVRLILEGTASDVHPPLYYLALRGWRELTGDSEFSLRSFSVFAGLLLVAGVMALARALAQRGREWALLAGLLAAVSPSLVYYSQEARMYQLLGLTAVLSTWILLLWLRRGGRPLALVYLLIVAAGLYTHYFFPAVLAGHGVILAMGVGRAGRKPAPTLVARWTLLVVGAWLLYLPWLPVFMRTMGGAGREALREGIIQFGADSGQWLLLGETIGAGDVGWIGWAAAAMLVGLPLGISRKGAKGQSFFLASWRPGLILLAAILLPLALMFLGGLARAAYLKFLIVAAPFVSLLLAAGLSGWRQTAWPVGWALLLALLAGQAISLDNLYHNPAYARADYRGMAARIAAENHPNAGIILNAPNQWEVFTYYHREGAPAYPLPQGWPDAVQIAAQLEQIAADHQRLYAIFWGETERDPERLVERWLDAYAFKATDEWVGDVRFVIYAVPDEIAGEMTAAVNLPFGPSIILLGYTTNATAVQPGDILQVTLFWQTAEPLTDRYKIFLHLVDERGEIIAQRDSEPGGGLALTTTWPPGETIVDNHGILLPVGMSDGRYTLRLGLYDVADPTARLPIHTPDGQQDFLVIETLLLSR